MIPSQPWLSPKLALRSIEGRGEGLIAVDRIEPGEVVIVWGGASYVDHDRAEEARAQGLGDMQWDEDLFSVEGDDHPAFAINHGCDANVWLRDAFNLVARRAIVPGEEATIDYATFISDETFVSPWTCSCGSPRCRHTIRGADWRIPGLQAEYRGHFSPLIQRRIDHAPMSPKRMSPVIPTCPAPRPVQRSE